MGRAYAYALGDAPRPFELDLHDKVSKYGAEAVFGRPLTARDMRDMDTAEKAAYIIRMYHEREMSENWAEWAQRHSAINEVLMKLHEDYLKWQNR